MTQIIKDAKKNHWVYRMPARWRPYLQLARYDRPIGYWLLTLPGWIALSFASLSHGLAWTDLKWAALILIGAIAMRGAGCTYNDIVDRDLDAKVERTALRPIPAGTVSVKQAWIWLAAQCFVGLLVLLLMPHLAQIIALCAIPLVAAYPFMKRITWWPQVWLGLTFNWAALVAYAAKTGEINEGIGLLYFGLIFWTIGYDTVYACQDIEDDAFIGIKSTARRFGRRVKMAVGICYAIFLFFVTAAVFLEPFGSVEWIEFAILGMDHLRKPYIMICAIAVIPTGVFLFNSVKNIEPDNGEACLRHFKRNTIAAFLLIISLLAWKYIVVNLAIYTAPA